MTEQIGSVPPETLAGWSDRQWAVARRHIADCLHGIETSDEQRWRDQYQLRLQHFDDVDECGNMFFRGHWVGIAILRDRVSESLPSYMGEPLPPFSDPPRGAWFDGVWFDENGASTGEKWLPVTEEEARAGARRPFRCNETYPANQRLGWLPEGVTLA